jgi:hypothetical protein
MVWNEAKLLADSDRSPHSLAMPGSQRWEGCVDVGTIVNSTEPDLQTVTDAMVLNTDDGKTGLNTK